MTENVTTTSVSLSWEKPIGNASSYLIEIVEDPTLGKIVFTTFDTIGGLTPGYYYTFMVFALVGKNDVQGEKNSTYTYTKPDVITDLRTLNISTTSITLGWQIPVGNVSFYLIEMAGPVTVYFQTSINESVIEDLTPGNLYSFQVFAVVGEPNVLGNGLDISAYTKPGLVKNLTLDNITSTSVSLTWEKPDGNADSYMIQVLEDPSLNRIVTTTLNTIGGLTPGYYYTFMVFALVGNGTVPGDNNTISTYTEPEIVGNLRTVNVTTTSVSLSWEKPIGNADSYMIQIVEDPILKRIVTTTWNTIGGLTPGYYYTFMVFALVGNNSVQGEKNTTYTYTKPDVITDLRTLNISTTSITLGWQIPVGNVTFYLIEMAGPVTVYFQTSINESVIEDLTPGNLYSFRLFAVVGEPNVLGNGLEISAYTRPEVVEDLKLQDISTTSATLVWQLPIGYAQSYLIQIVGDPSFIINTTLPSATIGNLIPGNYYTALVSAVVQDMIVGESKNLSFNTDPGIVKNLTLDNITTTSVSLTWEKPDGNVDSYMIQVLEDPSLNRIVTTSLNTIGGLTPGYYYTFMVFALVGNYTVPGDNNTISTYTEPEIVGNLRTKNVTTTSVSLSWEKPIGNASSYMIQVLEDPSLNRIVTTTLNTVGGLTPGYYYTFMVFALVGNNSVQGEKNTTYTYTKPDVITDLRTLNISTTSITLGWQIPVGNVSFYLIEMAGPVTVYFQTSINESVIKDLTPGNLYSFQVFPVVGEPNVLGNGLRISAYTKPEVVKNLMTGIITTTSISLSWEKPDGNTSSYEIQILGDPTFNKTVTSTSDTIEGLTPGNYYILLVTAVVGENNVTGSSSVISVYTKPEVVKNLKPGIITTTSISLSWEKPVGNASSYGIQILGDPTFNKTVTSISDTIEGLTPGNHYILLVTAVVGENNVTGNSSVIPVYTKPEVVKNLMTGIITTTSISLSWEKPDGNASSYEIQILGEPTFNKTEISTSDTIEGLTPGNYYALLVTASVGDDKVTGNGLAISVYTISMGDYKLRSFDCLCYT
ncbi:receptor-type tyrosine-protein phosphatase eta-like [Phyllobates terribilis]|uniref:receptor-type tyrosine-protein phosphatase eta-like n=1 Tax=Phyllobates terribilis TaxID=111132 RepID=UPI003CCB373B